MKKEVLKEKTSLFSIFFTFAVDNLGATIVFPIFAPLFLDPAQKLFLPTTSLSYKTTMLGIFLGVFPFMQFIFSPILGEYGDHQGRKKALLFTTFLTFSGFFLSAWSIYHHHLSGIFLGRVIMGIGAGNLSICLSSISDLSPSTRKKNKYFSYGSAIAGLTFILGPYVGGKLSEPTINPFFSSAFPMLVGAILGTINFLFILFAFEETLKGKSKKNFDLLKGVRNIFLVLNIKTIRPLYLIYFFYLFSWNIIFLFIPAFMVQNFHLNNSKIGDVCALLGVCWVFGTGVLHYLIHGSFRPKLILLISFGVLASLVVFIPYPHHLKNFVFILGGCTIISGLIWPFCTGAISSKAPSEIQGKVMGLSQSMLSLTMMFSSIIGGFFLHAHSAIPFIFSSFSLLIAGVILLKTKMS